jgi:hypothetical protein
MKRPEVRDHYQAVQIEFVESIESDKPLNLARAYETGIDLMKNSKSDAVKARMVEFFLAEKKMPPQITINNTLQSKGYEYVRPGQRIVDVLDAEEVARDRNQRSSKLNSETAERAKSIEVTSR